MVGTRPWLSVWSLRFLAFAALGSLDPVSAAQHLNKMTTEGHNELPPGTAKYLIECMWEGFYTESDAPEGFQS